MFQKRAAIDRHVGGKRVYLLDLIGQEHAFPGEAEYSVSLRKALSAAETWFDLHRMMEKGSSA